MGIIIFFYIIAIGHSLLSKSKGFLFTILALPVLPFMFFYDMVWGSEKQKQDALVVIKVVGLAIGLFVFYYLIYLAFKY